MRDPFSAIIIHYDEIGLKGKNQMFFIRKLIDNIKKMTEKNIEVKRSAGKLILRLGLEKEAIEQLRLMPGISNFAPAFLIETDLEKIKEAALAVCRFYKPETFKVETTRAYKQFPLNSMEVSCKVGEYILQSIGVKAKVDVKKPDLLIKIEIEKKQTAVLGKEEKGIGGLPVGSAGKVVALISGGIDSPVAAFEMMKRGAEVVFVHFHNQTIQKKNVESKIKRLVQRLAEIQGGSKLYIIPFADLQKEVIAKVKADLRMLVYRRLMFRIAEKIAKQEKALALITGDSLGQVASQTLENLAVIYQAADMLKLTPLIGQNKAQIMEIAREIGTYDISIEPYADCCSLMIAKHPETRATIEEIQRAEKNLDVEKLICREIKSGYTCPC